MPASGADVLTIGHSTHSMGAFIELLQRHGVTAIADVRAAPYSRFNPQFNRESLARSLVARGIAYVFLGSELGGRSNDPACYDRGSISYERLSSTPSFQDGLDRVAKGTNTHRIALMCAEKEPLECHRCLLVASALQVRSVSIAHIRPEYELEPHAETMHRLLAIHGMEDTVERQRLFPRSRDERIAEAIARQARRFAHRNAMLADDSTPPKRQQGDLQT